MKKNTKIFNTEVIERLALSDNIPPFDEQRNGTQVIMIEEGKKRHTTGRTAESMIDCVCAGAFILQEKGL